MKLIDYLLFLYTLIIILLFIYIFVKKQNIIKNITGIDFENISFYLSNYCSNYIII